MSTSHKVREFHQVNRPHGMPTATDFELVTTDLPTLSSGEALVENVYLSLDPYMRECMDGEWKWHAPLEGRAVGRIVDGGDSGLFPGQWVFHRAGWRSHAAVAANDLRVLPSYSGVSPRTFLSLLGGTGLTAYVALTQVAKLQAGEDIYVSAAAGGVGTATVQIARLLGAGRLIGSTSRPEKVRQLTEVLGYDRAIDYSSGAISDSLAATCPDGFDIAIENVGGEHLEATIASIRPHGRIAWVGAVSQYNVATPPNAPRNLYDIVGKRLRLEGFLVRDYRELQGELEALLVPALQSGQIVPHEHLITGIDQMPMGFISMLSGANVGKTIVQIADD